MATLKICVQNRRKTAHGRSISVSLMELVMCLAGINTVDLYSLKMRDFHDGILHYRMAKTTAD